MMNERRNQRVETLGTHTVHTVEYMVPTTPFSVGYFRGLVDVDGVRYTVQSTASGTWRPVVRHR